MVWVIGLGLGFGYHTHALWGAINQHSVVCLTALCKSMGAWLTVGPSGRRPGPARELAGRLMTQLDALWGAINQRSILMPAAFVFLWQVLSRGSCGAGLRVMSTAGSR